MSHGTLARAALWLVVCAGEFPSLARAQTGPNDLPPGYRQREVHDPSSSRYLWRGDRGSASNPGGGGGGAGFVPIPVPVPGWYPPYFYRPFGYPPYYGYPYGYPLYPPPVWIPAEQMYGPGAVWRMFNSSQASTTASNLAAKSPEIARPQPAPVAQAPPKQKKVSEAARARADKYVESGDEAFRDQSYALALARYRRAIASAPDRAAWRFRAGQALVALGRYSDAAELFREGLEIDPAAPRGEMRLDTLYGQNKIAKVAHLESLAQEALTQPTNSDLLFLLGVELFADGQRARSRKFFERANELALGANRHLQSFLTVIPPEHEVAEKDAAAGQRDL